MVTKASKRIPMYNALSLSEWGKTQGISYKTAWRMYREGKLPSGTAAQQLPTGTIRIREILERANIGDEEGATIYARINPRQQREDLEKQVSICQSFCAANGWSVVKTQREIAPALGIHRRKLHRLLDPPPRRLVVWRPSILSRFDFCLLDACLRHCRCRLVVVDKSEEARGEGGALEDLVDAISQVCHRHYGLKRGNLILDEFRKVIDLKPV